MDPLEVGEGSREGYGRLFCGEKKQEWAHFEQCIETTQSLQTIVELELLSGFEALWRAESGMERVVQDLGSEMDDKKRRQKFEEIGTELDTGRNKWRIVAECNFRKQ